MNLETYAYETLSAKQFSFTSIGKKRIIKLVQFSITTHENMVALGFGDELPDGSVDDRCISDNGDMVKVFATVIRIVDDLTKQFPHLTVGFAGSTPMRTRLYNRILKTYYSEFSKEFDITALIEKEGTLYETKFEPDKLLNYVVYFIKRKI